jgi:hypothetical protein
MNNPITSDKNIFNNLKPHRPPENKNQAEPPKTNTSQFPTAASGNGIHVNTSSRAVTEQYKADPSLRQEGRNPGASFHNYSGSIESKVPGNQNGYGNLTTGHPN